jgi:flavin reductase (DIM6/NTAB) family NADH-FMN oxidoreductase RutF
VSGQIHEEHPFRTPEELRDPLRQLRGRMPAPVTIVTAGDAVKRTGLTVSSLVVAEGDPGRVYFLLGPETDLYDVLHHSSRFVVHVLRERHRALSDVFAGARPSPGGLFVGVDVEQTGWGPVLTDVTTRAYCTYRGGVEESYSFLVSGTVDRVEIDDLTDPLLYFRGGYRTLG